MAVDDRHFFTAKYQQAMLYVDQDKLKDAETSLKAILYPQSQRMATIAGVDTRKDLNDYAYMALGRIYYEEQRFPDSAKMYRNVSRDGSNFLRRALRAVMGLLHGRLS